MTRHTNYDWYDSNPIAVKLCTQFFFFEQRKCAPFAIHTTFSLFYSTSGISQPVFEGKMHFANTRSDPHYTHTPVHKSPPPQQPLGPPRLYNLNNGSPPVYVKKVVSSPRPHEHSPHGRIQHASPSQHSPGAQPLDGVLRSESSPSSPQLQPRSVSHAPSDPQLSPTTPGQRPSAKSMSSALVSPPTESSKTTSFGAMDEPSWLLSSKPLRRGGGRSLLHQQSDGSPVGGALSVDPTISQVRQFLHSPLSLQMPSLQQASVIPADYSPLTVGSSKHLSPLHNFDATRRRGNDYVQREVSHSMERAEGAQTLLEPVLAMHLRDAEQHHREALVEAFIAAFQEMRLDCMMQRNAMLTLHHRRSELLRDVIASSSPNVASVPATVPQERAPSMVWMARPHIGFPEAHTGSGEERSASDALQTLLARQHQLQLDERTPMKQTSAFHGNSPMVSSTSATKDSRAASVFDRYRLSAGQTPRTIASANAADALRRVLQDEERSRRTLLEASSTNASVILRQIFQCCIRGLHPTTLFVQEQHSFNTLMSAFEEESISVNEQYQRWLWEQRAERIQFWSRRLSTLRLDEDRARESTTMQQRDSWSEILRRAELGRQQIARDAEDERMRVDTRFRRSTASLLALEATIRDKIFVEQQELRADIGREEELSFHASLQCATRTGGVVAGETSDRADVEWQEMHHRREFLQAFKWMGPAVSAMPTPSPAAGGVSSLEGSPASDHLPGGNHSAGSLEDSGYLNTIGAVEQRVQQRTPRRRRSPAVKQQHPTSSVPSTEHYMRHTASSSRRRSSPGTDRSLSQDNQYAPQIFGADFVVPPPIHYETASSIRHPASSMASDAEVPPTPALRQRAPSPLNMQRTIDRLSKPKKRHAEHVIDGEEELPSYTLSSASLSNTVQPRRGVKVNAASPRKKSSPSRRSAFGRGEPMATTAPRDLVRGNSVMILRGGGPAEQQRRPAAGKRASTLAPQQAVAPPSSIRSARRYVDAFLAADTPIDQTASIYLSQSPITASGNSLLSTETTASNNRHLPPTGRRSEQQTVPVVARNGPTRKDAAKLSKWEAATLLMYEQSKRNN